MRELEGLSLVLERLARRECPGPVANEFGRGEKVAPGCWYCTSRLVAASSQRSTLRMLAQQAVAQFEPEAVRRPARDVLLAEPPEVLALHQFSVSLERSVRRVRRLGQRTSGSLSWSCG